MNAMPSETHLVPSGEDTLLRVKVTPRARASRLGPAVAGKLRVMLAAPPEKGKANAELISLLAGCLQVPKSDIIIKSGAGSRDKLVLIRRVPAEEVQRRIQDALRSELPRGAASEQRRPSHD